MLVVAIVNLSDLPAGSVVEVDPKNERIEGLLRGGYIQPVEHQPMAVSAKPPKASK